MRVPRCPTFQSADATELAEICDAFRITVTYDKPNRTIELSATIVPELLPKNMNPTYTEGAVGVFVYSGGGVCTQIPDAPKHLCGRVYQITEVRKLP